VHVVRRVDVSEDPVVEAFEVEDGEIRLLQKLGKASVVRPRKDAGDER
jgi:hypothetical protein